VKAIWNKGSGLPIINKDSLKLNDGGEICIINVFGVLMKVYLKIKDVDVKNFNMDT